MVENEFIMRKLRNKSAINKGVTTGYLQVVTANKKGTSPAYNKKEILQFCPLTLFDVKKSLP